MLRRIRLWLMRKLCPRIRMTVRCGKIVNGRFCTVRQFIFWRQTDLEIAIDVDFIPETYKVKIEGRDFTQEEILAMIDHVTEAEGSLPDGLPDGFTKNMEPTEKFKNAVTFLRDGGMDK